MTAADVKILQERYELLEKIGSGGIGAVYRARDLRLERTVAVKSFYERHLSSLAAFKKRWIETTQVSHPNIIVVYDLFEEEGKTYLVMEYMPAGSLREKIRAKGQLAIQDSVRIIVEVLKGIRFLHDRGIYHRDLKPENILFLGDQVKLSDFDIAHLPEAQFTRIGFQPGTLPYMAPEQVRGEKLTPAADLHAAGAILCEMLTGCHYLGLKEDISKQEMERLILKQPPVPIGQYRKNVPGKINEMVMKALEKAPKDRYQSPEKMLSDLQRIPDLEISYPEPPLIPVRKQKMYYIKYWLPFLILAFVCGVIFWWFQRRGFLGDSMGAFAKKSNQYLLLAYDPTDFNPDEGRDPPETSIEKDIKTLWQYGFLGVVTFGSKGVLARIPEIAKRNGMKFVVMGVWNPKDEQELKAAKEAVNHVDGYCMGHDGLGKRYDFEELKQAIGNLKSMTRNPVTTAEKLADYSSTPELLDIGDWAFPDIHGYWHEGTSPEMMVKWTIEAMKRVDVLMGTSKKPIIVKMVSFPSGPVPISSEAAQTQFFTKLFMAVKNRTDIPRRVKLSYLGAFDTPWKVEKRGWAPGEKFTGLFTSDRKPKKALEVFKKSVK
jgi:serine/threonine protein kinase